ncbi:MAG: HEAT repeat domain-containing protein [Byssovorax sp.]
MVARRISVLFALPALASLTSLTSLGCREPMSPAEMIADLRSPDAAERTRAAHGLRAHNTVPPEAVPSLFQAIQVEQNKKARGEELMALATSGSPQAEPFICKAVYDPDVDVRRWGKQALTIWLPMNQQSKGCPPPP